MTYFFTILYIKTNRWSDEKIAIGLLANFDNVPSFGYSKVKLNFALKSVNKELSLAIKRSLNILEQDVNKIIKGERSLTMFDTPYAEQILKKLTLKKRGILIYSDIHQVNRPASFTKIYKKMIGEVWQIDDQLKTKNISFNSVFKKYTSGKKFNDFTRNHVLSQDMFPLLYAPIKVDLVRKTSFYTAFHAIDLNQSDKTIQTNLIQFKLIVDSLKGMSKTIGLSKGRYYLVYKASTKINTSSFLEKVKNENNDFEIIKLNELKDKI